MVVVTPSDDVVSTVVVVPVAEEPAVVETWVVVVDDASDGSENVSYRSISLIWQKIIRFEGINSIFAFLVASFFSNKYP